MINYNMLKKGNMFKKRKNSMSIGKAAAIVGAGAGLGIGLAVAYKMKDTIKENVVTMFDKYGCGCGCNCSNEDEEESGYKYYVGDKDDDHGYYKGYGNTVYYRRDRVNKKVPKGINGIKRVY